MRVGQQAVDVVRAEAGDRRRLEPGECPPVALALPQNGRPRQPRLRAFQDEQLVQLAVVPRRHAHSSS